MNPSKRVCRHGSTDQPMPMSVATGRGSLPTTAALCQSSICSVNSAYQDTPLSALEFVEIVTFGAWGMARLTCRFKGVSPQS